MLREEGGGRRGCSNLGSRASSSRLQSNGQPAKNNKQIAHKPMRQHRGNWTWDAFPENLADCSGGIRMELGRALTSQKTRRTTLPCATAG